MNSKWVDNSQLINCLIIPKLLFLKLILILCPNKRWFNQLLIPKEYWKLILPNPAILYYNLKLVGQHDVLIFGHVICAAGHKVTVGDAAVVHVDDWAPAEHAQPLLTLFFTVCRTQWNILFFIW